MESADNFLNTVIVGIFNSFTLIQKVDENYSLEVLVAITVSAEKRSLSVTERPRKSCGFRWNSCRSSLKHLTWSRAQSWHPFCEQSFRFQILLENIMYPFIWDENSLNNLTQLQFFVNHRQVRNFNVCGIKGLYRVQNIQSY